MTDEWVSAIAQREWFAGFGSGLVLGVLVAVLFGACVVAAALAEAGQ